MRTLAETDSELKAVRESVRPDSDAFGTGMDHSPAAEDEQEEVTVGHRRKKSCVPFYS